MGSPCSSSTVFELGNSLIYWSVDWWQYQNLHGQRCKCRKIGKKAEKKRWPCLAMKNFVAFVNSPRRISILRRSYNGDLSNSNVSMAEMLMVDHVNHKKLAKWQRSVKLLLLRKQLRYFLESKTCYGIFMHVKMGRVFYLMILRWSMAPYWPLRQNMLFNSRNEELTSQVALRSEW